MYGWLFMVSGHNLLKTLQDLLLFAKKVRQKLIFSCAIKIKVTSTISKPSTQIDKKATKMVFLPLCICQDTHLRCL